MAPAGTVITPALLIVNPAGAFFAPIICASWIGAKFGYQYGFLAAAIGMIFGVVVFQFRKGMLGHIGKAPAGREGITPILVVLGGAVLMVPLIYVLLSSMAKLIEENVLLHTQNVERGEQIRSELVLNILERAKKVT